MRLPLFVVALLLPGSLSAQTDWTSASKVDVTLANFKYEPRVIRLPAGRPVTLHLVNSASGGHDRIVPHDPSQSSLKLARARRGYGSRRLTRRGTTKPHSTTPYARLEDRRFSDRSPPSWRSRAHQPKRSRDPDHPTSRSASEFGRARNRDCALAG